MPRQDKNLSAYMQYRLTATILNEEVQQVQYLFGG